MKSRDGENTLRREEQWLVWGRVAMRTYDAWPNILGTRRYGRTALASPTPSSSHPCRFLLFSSSRLSRSQTRPARLRSSRRNSHRASDPSARTSTPSADLIKVARRRSSHVYEPKGYSIYPACLRKNLFSFFFSASLLFDSSISRVSLCVSPVTDLMCERINRLL